MSSDEKRVVQTNLPAHEYRRFRRVAEEEGISLKEALRRAANAYADEGERVDPSDPLFETVTDLDEGAGERTSAREMDELYEEPDE